MVVWCRLESGPSRIRCDLSLVWEERPRGDTVPSIVLPAVGAFTKRSPKTLVENPDGMHSPMMVCLLAQHLRQGPWFKGWKTLPQQRNVLIDEVCQATGLVEWELSVPKPFAEGLGRIHTLAGKYTGGEFWVPEESEVAERAF